MTRPTIAVGGVVVEDGRILVIRRAHEPGEGLWAVPGGRVEPDETVRHAVAREVREETGLDVEVGDLAWWGRLGSGDHPYLVFDYLASISGGDLRAGSDALEARWVPIERLDELPLVPSMLELLDTL